MRLLLTHGFFLAEDPKEQPILRPYPPLGILYISAYLRSRGFEVDVYDSTWGSREELFRLLDDGPPAISIDDVSLPKDGRMSVGVAPQYCGK